MILANSLIAITLISATTAPNRQTLVYEASVPLQTLDWDYNVELPGFDPAIGCLARASITLSGTAVGDYAYESLQSTPTEVHYVLSAEFTLSTIEGAVLIEFEREKHYTDIVDSFDGVFDFSGPSSGSVMGLTLTDEQTITLDLRTWSGSFITPGEVSLRLTAEGPSGVGCYVCGPCIIFCQHMNLASAQVILTYEFIPHAPGDFDGNGDVDLVDFGEFQLCYSGPGQPSEEGCDRGDFDADGDVDLADFAAFQLAFTGTRSGGA